jgi:uncharacterized protein (TIGR03435 family)
MRILLAFGMGLLTLARAQEFEAASVKLAAPPTLGMMRIGTQGGPGTPDPTRINFSNISLKDVVARAYDAKRTQIIGPDWLDSQRFDITATMAPGTTKEQFNVMLQKLLADRFGLTLHRDKKEMAAFVLTVSKKGLKMKESPDPVVKEGDPKPEDAPPPPLPPPGKIQMGKDGIPQMPTRGRGMPMMMVMPGRARTKAEGATMDQLTKQLEGLLNRPVVDQTGLKGKYDYDLTFAPDMATMFGGRGPMMMAPPPGGAGGGGGEAHPEMKDDNEAPLLPVALQEQLGLKLDSHKTMVEVLVIDHLEKVPSEN